MLCFNHIQIDPTLPVLAFHRFMAASSRRRGISCGCRNFETVRGLIVSSPAEGEGGSGELSLFFLLFHLQGYLGASIVRL